MSPEEHPNYVLFSDFCLQRGYQLVRCIAFGGQGIVFEATDIKSEKRVAIKQVGSASVLEEAKLLRSLVGHVPGVLPIVNILEDGRFFAIVMRLIEGVTVGRKSKRCITLAEYISELRNEADRRGEPLESRRHRQQALDILHQVSFCLKALHSPQIRVYHRDIKPDNVLLEPGRNGIAAYLVDFGIANAEAGETPQYSLPTYRNCKGMGEARDIFAIGCVFFFVLTGELFWTEKGRMEVLDDRSLAEHVEQRLKLVRSLRCRAAIRRYLEHAHHDSDSESWTEIGSGRS